MTDGTAQHNTAKPIDNSPVYFGEVYLAQSGEYAFRVYENNELYVAGSGFEDEIQAAEACGSAVPDVEFPILWIAITPPQLAVLDRVEATNSTLFSLADYWFKHPHDSMDSEGVLELLSYIHDTLNGSTDDDEVDE